MKQGNIIIAIVVLVLALACCNEGGDTANMRELAGIDSLLSKARQYEVAQQRLDSLHPDGFNQAERAYYSLLLSQSHYKNYINDTTDAVINKAVDYYEHHGDREKYTRSLLYKGCVYQMMGDAEKAIASYKDAENAAEDGDLENKAFAKLRLATLYADNSNYADLKIRKYKEALDLYNQLGDKHYQIVCLTDMGGYYRSLPDKRDSALFYINQAIQLSEDEHENWFLFQNLYQRAEMYCLLTKEYDKARVDILKAIAAGKDEIDHPRAHYVAAETYLNLGRPDSALYYLNHVPASGMMSNHTSDTVMYCRLMSEIAKANKDWNQYTTYYDRANEMADSILVANVNKNYLAIEKKYDIQLAELNRQKEKTRTTGALLLASLLALLALALTFVAWRYRSRLKQKETENELQKTDLETSLTGLQQMQIAIANYEQELRAAQDELRGKEAQMSKGIAALEAKIRQSDEMRNIVDNQINVIHQLLQMSFENNSAAFARRFKEMMTLPDEGAVPTDSYWSNLHMLANDLHGNVLVEAQRTSGGTLNDSELNFLALYSCGFSRTVIMMCMKYTSLGTVSNKKIQIAKKLGVQNLDDFVNNYR
jgi:tetratricopeptide (TPR) repeat protein